MNLSNTWVNSRKNKLLAFSIDFILCISFYQIIYFNKFNSYPNKLVTLVLSTFWLILSYILGRYDQIKKIKFKSFYYSLIKVTINFLVCNFIYLIINWGFSVILFILTGENFIQTQDKDLNNFFIEALLVITIFSFFIQYLINTANNKIEGSRTFLFYGNKNIYNEVFSQISNIKKDIKLLRISNKDNLDSNIFDESTAIIISDYSKIKERNLEVIYSQKKNGFEVLSLLK